jgi:protein-L-isoaspartate(D-aspartate) O-methyltransferase
MIEDFNTLVDNKYKEQRLLLAEQLREKGISDEETLAAIAFVPREFFVHHSFINRSYEDTALPIDCMQTISQPYTVAYMTSLLNIIEGSKVLEIGTGSGYQACILRVLGAKVFSIERIPQLYHSLVSLFHNLKVKINLKLGDGTMGWRQYAPYDAIIVTAAAPYIPKELKNQLAVGGRLVIPVGDRDSQIMYLVVRKSQAEFEETPLDDFKFVPLIGQEGWNE